jgi:DNA polymerase-3 subunit epsilon
MAGLQKSPGSCFDFRVHQCHGACTGKEKPAMYNRRVNKAIASFTKDNLSAIILGKGRTDNESSVIWIENGKYHGFGFFNSNIDILHSSQLKDFIKQYPDNQDIQRILQMSLSTRNEFRIIPIES